MKLITIIFLSIAFLLSYVETFGKVDVGYASQSTIDPTALQQNVRTTTEYLPQGIESSFSLLTMVFKFFSIVSKMMAFSYTIPDAPTEINYILRFFFGILAWLGLIDIIKYVISLAGLIFQKLKSPI